jgi:hypothetical protein
MIHEFFMIQNRFTPFTFNSPFIALILMYLQLRMKHHLMTILTLNLTVWTVFHMLLVIFKGNGFLTVGKTTV